MAKTTREYLKQANITEKLEKILKETETPFEGKQAQDIMISFKIGKQQYVITKKPQEKMEIRTYEIKKNENIKKLFNMNSTAIYLDRKEGDFYQYVFSPSRKRILRKILIEKHDIINLFAFCVYAMFPNKQLKVFMRVGVPMRIRKKIAKLRKKEYEDGESNI